MDLVLSNTLVFSEWGLILGMNFVLFFFFFSGKFGEYEWMKQGMWSCHRILWMNLIDNRGFRVLNMPYLMWISSFIRIFVFLKNLLTLVISMSRSFLIPVLSFC